MSNQPNSSDTPDEDLAGAFANASIEDFLRPSDTIRSALPHDTFWAPYEPRDVSHITSGGDLVLDIRDLFSANGFWGGTLTATWAAMQMLSLEGLDESAVLVGILYRSLIPALKALPDAKDVIAAFKASLTGAPTPELPDFRVIVNGELAAVHTVMVWDGPFDTEADIERAIARRVLRAQQSDEAPTDNHGD